MNTYQERHRHLSKGKENRHIDMTLTTLLAAKHKCHRNYEKLWYVDVGLVFLSLSLSMVLTHSTHYSRHHTSASVCVG